MYLQKQMLRVLLYILFFINVFINSQNVSVKMLNVNVEYIMS